MKITSARSIWTPNFILHSSAYFLMSLSFYLLLATLPIYVTEILGEDKSKVGYIIGVYSLAALAIRPFGGYALDAYGRKPIFLAALIFFVAVSASYLLSYSFFILLVIRIFHGITWGIVTTGGATIAADIIPEQKRGEGLGYFGLMITLAMAIGPMAGLKILGPVGSWSFDRLFMASLITSALALLLSLQVQYSTVRRKSAGIRFSDFVETRVTSLAFVMLIVAVSYAGIISFITLYAQELDIAQAGSFFLAYAVGVAILRPFAGKFMDQRGPKLLMASSFCLYIIGFLLLSRIEGEIGFLLSAFIIGLGNGIIMPTAQAMVVNMVSAEQRGIANATLYSALDLGIGLGSVALGYLTEVFSIATMYLFCGLMMIVPIVYFLIFVVKDYENKIKTVSK